MCQVCEKNTCMMVMCRQWQNRLDLFCISIGLTERVTVSNLAWTTDEQELAAHLSKAGHIVGIEIQRHADTQRSKGWA